MITAAQYAAPFENDFVLLEEFNDKYRWHHLLEVQPREGPYRAGKFLHRRGTALQPGPCPTRAKGRRRLVVHQLVLLRALRRRYRAWSPAIRGRLLGEATPTSCTWSTGRKPNSCSKAGKTKKINGGNVLPIDVAVKEGVLFLIPEVEESRTASTYHRRQIHDRLRKARHHATGVRLAFEKIQAAIKAGQVRGQGSYGIPIIRHEEILHKQVELGLGRCIRSTTASLYRVHFTVRRQ